MTHSHRGVAALVIVLMALAAGWAGVLTRPAPASADAGADRVFVGAYIKDLQDIDVAAESFTVDVYLWLRWTNPNINPPATLEVMNSNGFQNTTTSSTGGVAPQMIYDAPVEEPDGSKYMLMRYQGVFSRKLMLQNYPFDTQVLRVVFKDQRADTRTLNFVPDTRPISINRSLLDTIPGYSLGTPTLSIIDHQYETNFGDSRVPPDGVPFSCITIDLPVKRNALPYIVKLFIPIFIVVLITALIFVLPARLEEARAGIGITALLTIIALQWSTEGDLPSVEYLTMLDVIYILSMIYIAAATGYSVLASRRNHQEMSPALTAALDRRVGLISLGTYAALVALTIFLHVYNAPPATQFFH
ncbi:hypothetical protein OG976_18730 [Mycobacterium sp. NBC_00419]|uniref:hypothetical protein n=1 Tax=Mycobacterium sp. NBC_00419 TaxID=2975989 RepID=UPI002E212F78